MTQRPQSRPWFINFFKSSPIEIFTDGSSKKAMGSWAYIITQKDKILKQDSGRVRRANSNAMEFQAVIEALKFLQPKSKAVLFSDSRIFVDAMTKNAVPFSMKNQCEILENLLENLDVTFVWIKAHNGTKFNEKCDEMCVAARSV